MSEMNRRDACKALAAVAGAAGLSVTPVTTQDAQGVELVILKSTGRISQVGAAQLRAVWKEAVQGTSLEQTRTLIVDDGLDVEFVRTRHA